MAINYLSLDLAKAGSADEMMDMLRSAHKGLETMSGLLGKGGMKTTSQIKKFSRAKNLIKMTDSPMVLKTDLSTCGACEFKST